MDAYSPGPGRLVPPDLLTLPHVPHVPAARQLAPTPLQRAMGFGAALAVPVAVLVVVVCVLAGAPVVSSLLGGGGAVLLWLAAWRLLTGDYREARRELRARAHSPRI